MREAIIRDLPISNVMSPDLRIVADANNYVRQLSKMSDEDFVLGFGLRSDTEHQRDEMRAAVELISAAPNIPLRGYGALASKLTAAIEGVMEVLVSAADVQWKRDWTYPSYGLFWRIDVLGGSGIKTRWNVPVGQHRARGSFAPHLTAGLSLSIYSFICGNNSLSRLYGPISVGWQLREKGLTLGKPAGFLRIIGNSELYTRGDIRSWISGLGTVLIPFAEIAAYDGTEDGRLYDSRGNDCQSRPIFGIYNSASFK